MVVGTRLNYVMGFGRPPRFAEAARWIRIDIDPEEIAGRPVDVGIVGDARTVLRQIGESLDGRIDPKRYEGWRTRPAEIHREKQSAPEARLTNHHVQIGTAPSRGRCCKFIANPVVSSTQTTKQKT